MSVSVQVHPDKFDVTFFPAEGTEGAFAIVRAHEDRATISLFLPSAARCDALIRAAVEAKDKLIEATGAQVRVAVEDGDATAILAQAITDGTPVIVEDDHLCPAFTDTDGGTVFCDRGPGHPGSHHGPGPDEGSEVAWSDEPEASQS